MKTYDCFSYLDEDFLLDIRLNILNEFVDYFVIVESNKTWQNNHKNHNFDISKFQKFKEKIIYIKISDMPEGDNPYLRENYQRNCILKGIEKADKDDLIIISDLDEIPNLRQLKNFKSTHRYAVFKQKHFYYKFNLQSKNHPYWNGTRACVKKYLKSPQWLRDLKFKKRPFWRIDKLGLNNIIEDGGWHFCNLKKPEELLYKYQNLCETNDPLHFKEKIDEKYLRLNYITKRVLKGEDIIGRNDKFNKSDVDKTFPKYLIKNKHKYLEWIA